MRIRIYDDFDGDLDAEYKSIDNDTIIGNGALSKENVPIIDVKTETIKDDEVKSYINNKTSSNSNPINSNNNLESNRKDKLSLRNENNKKKERNEYIEESIRGKITVSVRLDDRNGKPISEVKINLYALNGLSPKLVRSKSTDVNGVVVFDNLPEGSYRVIEIVNRKYFEKPTYIQWNEVTINKDLREKSIIVINKIKKYSK